MKRIGLSAVTELVSLLTFGSGCNGNAPTPEVAPLPQRASIQENLSLEQAVSSYNYGLYEYGSESPTSAPRKGIELSPVGGNLKYSLVAVPDEGTVLDPKKTEKVKRVVEHLFAKDKQPKLISYDDSPHGWEESLQRVEVVARISPGRYTITALNFSCIGGNSRCNEDELSLSILPNGRKEYGQIIFMDWGLDGTVDYMGPYSLLPFEKPLKLFGRTLLADTRYTPRDDRSRIDQQLDKKAVADTLYTTALDRIIAFYEKKQ